LDVQSRGKAVAWARPSATFIVDTTFYRCCVYFGHAKAPADLTLVSNGTSDWRAHGDRANLLIHPISHLQSGLTCIEPCRSWIETQEEGSMNAKAIPATLAPGHTDPPLDGSAASQVAMVVMLVPIPTPTTGVSAARQEPTPPTYVDSHDHVWLLVDKASPMAAVFEQLTAAESVAMPENNHHQAVHNHSAWLDTSHSEPAHPDNAAFVETLSRREIDVLRLMADGRSNQEIAQVLVVALNTVKMHIKHIYRKLGVKKRIQAVAQAQVLGLLATTMH